MHTLIQVDETWILKGAADCDMSHSDEEFESPPLSPLMDTFNDEDKTNEDIPSILFDFNAEQTGTLATK